MTSVLPLGIDLSEKDFKKVREIVHDLCGINLHEGKRELVVARLSKRIRQLGMQNVGEYLEYVREQQTQDELVLMLDALSTNLTAFWRESLHFDFLASHAVPRMLARVEHDHDPRIRGWSAGCSSGEEPYSLAMLLLHALGGQASRLDIKILATDLSTRVLSIAKAGVYSAERVQPLPPEIARQFVKEESGQYGKQYRVSESIRSLVSFGRLNLMEDWPMRGPMDFIFCRNVMIYFDKPTQGRLVNRFWSLLRPGGMLFVGHSESLTGIDHKFQYLRPTVYEKV